MIDWKSRTKEHQVHTINLIDLDESILDVAKYYVNSYGIAPSEVDRFSKAVRYYSEQADQCSASGSWRTACNSTDVDIHELHTYETAYVIHTRTTCSRCLRPFSAELEVSKVQMEEYKNKRYGQERDTHTQHIYQGLVKP